MLIIELKYEVTAIWKPGDLILWVSGGTMIRSLQPSYIYFFFLPKSSCSSLGEDSMNTQLRYDCDTPNKSWPWVSSEWLKITRKYKNLKQTFRFLEDVVRETKAQSGSFLRVSNAILSYERNNSLWFKSIPHSSIKRPGVDVRVYTIRIINLDCVDQSILLYVVITLFHFERRLHNVGAVCPKEKTEIKLKVQDMTPSSTYLDDFTNEVRLVRWFPLTWV